jgi:serine/threonine-protein kinase SRPK3
MGQQLDDELQMYKRMERGSKYHPGRNAVRSLLDSFDIDGPEDKHRCLVHPPLWESVLTFLHRNPVQRLPAPVLAFTLKRLFLALDYLHTECQIIHAGIYSNPILL